MNRDSEQIASYAARTLPLSSAHLGDEFFYQSLPLCVIDAVFSIGVQYKSVQKVGSRYCDWCGIEPFRSNRTMLPSPAEQQSIGVFCNKLNKVGHQEMAIDVFQNRQRTSTRNGILKAEAVSRFAAVLRDHRVEYFQDIPVAAQTKALEDSIRRIPGQKSGISLRYFWMLAGSDEFIKPDRMVLRFHESALSRTVTSDEAQGLLTAACEYLRKSYPLLTPRMLDHEIWKYQRKVTQN